METTTLMSRATTRAVFGSARPPLRIENDIMKAKIMPVPGSSDFIQLLPYDGLLRPKHFQNLSRCSASGKSLWTAELPTRSDSDAYVNVQVDGKQVIAWSWSCYRVELSIETGAIENVVFTK